MTRRSDEKTPLGKGRGTADDTGPRGGLDRRDFVRLAGLGAAALVGTASSEGSTPGGSVEGESARVLSDPDWPSLRFYPQERLARIALPLGGIGTGTVSLGGRGDLRDWEIMNRPAKGFVPPGGGAQPFFALFARPEGGSPVCRILEGPLESFEFEGSHGSPAPNAGLPRFRGCSFSSAYPFGRVSLRDAAVPLTVELKAFNPLIPADAEISGIPVAILTYELGNPGARPVQASVCGTIPNHIGIDGFESARDWKGDSYPTGASRNRNAYREGAGCRGIFFDSEGVNPRSEAWGTMALVTPAEGEVTHRTSWAKPEWGFPLLDFWDDFAADGRLEERVRADGLDAPAASLAVALDVLPGQTRSMTFLLAWHFPNRHTWTPGEEPAADDVIGNHYMTLYRDAWDVVEQTVPRLRELEEKTAVFVRTLCGSDLPLEVKEAALFNISTLRTQTCFRTPDGRFFGWEGSASRKGCCHGSCTHVWNYEQATPFLFGALARSMREVEFGFATDESGLMSFRVALPLGRSQEFGKAAADGQMGCLLKMYRDWQLSGDEALLRRLWPHVRSAVEFCWIEGGWDADQDGVMEGAQHNTMDVEYYGPNPQMGIWYLGALRAAEEMAVHLGERDFAATCRRLHENGRAWIDAHLFNGEYYQHEVRAPGDAAEIAPSLLVGMGSADVTRPDYQLAAGCLVDQLVGQFLAHVCGLGHLVDPDHVRRSLQSVLRYNLREDLSGHFNSMRSFALDSESALLMASYPTDRPPNPFPYFTEAMTGFEYTAAVEMIYEGMEAEGLECIRRVRARYDGSRRNPFDEAECGHHYARAMASWAAILAWTGFRYSAVTRTLTLAPRPGRFLWSSGYGWGEYSLVEAQEVRELNLRVLGGRIELSGVEVTGFGRQDLPAPRPLGEGASLTLTLRPGTAG
jgi:non-lysosomal glucosylceramidase